MASANETGAFMKTEKGMSYLPLLLSLTEVEEVFAAPSLEQQPALLPLESEQPAADFSGDLLMNFLDSVQYSTGAYFASPVEASTVRRTKLTLPVLASVRCSMESSMEAAFWASAVQAASDLSAEALFASLLQQDWACAAKAAKLTRAKTNNILFIGRKI